MQSWRPGDCILLRGAFPRYFSAHTRGVTSFFSLCCFAAVLSQRVVGTYRDDVSMYPSIGGNKRSGATTAGSERGVEGGATDRVGYVHRFPDLLKRWDDVDGDRGTW